MTLPQLIIELEHLVNRCGSQKALAERLNVSQAYLSDVLSGRREPGDKILAPLGLTRVVTYQKM